MMLSPVLLLFTDFSFCYAAEHKGMVFKPMKAVWEQLPMTDASYSHPLHCRLEERLALFSYVIFEMHLEWAWAHPSMQAEGLLSSCLTVNSSTSGHCAG